MSDEPINHKLLARNKHRGGKSVDKNTSRGKYKKEEFEKKKKEREEIAKREQDPNYQKNKKDNVSNDDDDDDEDDENIEEDGFAKHSRSKYSKRILVQKDNSKLVQLDDKYYNQSSKLNMQSLIDSKVDFIPKFENSSNSTTDLILDEINIDFNKKVNVNNSNSNSSSNSLNISEIEKMLSSFSLSKRLNIDEYYLNSMKLPNPNNVVYLKRKSNKHLATDSIASQSSQNISKTNTDSLNNNKKDDEKKDQEEFDKIIKSPIKDTAYEPPIDNGNVTSDNLEDWLDSII
ncbi:hypothetical protein DICPUDRAFT_153106 [Dictyostelium purpureum]|uniref:Uncharacterized protein n=1 Tax=Dictyostelium purpureum TaxID=5786 RepID=F0ZN28_DICPU|nr:uncharacterized protein DICPUDRAFT_153106 [Dictyostelium purpureum]EGC34651.1 hypothetical protein DICPUDRAFT_153106 [Dictyostelium purpureum]|eukprot:XP_003288832.1 hypothetical protein DICPUDRAFT_153106 [Dictyostelium purpureum]